LALSLTIFDLLCKINPQKDHPILFKNFAMLIQLVRPLVRTQIQMLTRTPSVNTKLVGMVAQWLGYLGVQAEVTQLSPQGNQIQVKLKVGKPEQCTEDEWRQILANLHQDEEPDGISAEASPYDGMTNAQKNKVHRLLACVLRASTDAFAEEWPNMRFQLTAMGMDEAMLYGIESATRVSMPMDLLIEDLEPEVASFALAKAINIALLDRQITDAEDNALSTLLTALKQQTQP
jgi:hypothetical protein